MIVINRYWRNKKKIHKQSIINIYLSSAEQNLMDILRWNIAQHLPLKRYSMRIEQNKSHYEEMRRRQSYRGLKWRRRNCTQLVHFQPSALPWETEGTANQPKASLKKSMCSAHWYRQHSSNSIGWGCLIYMSTYLISQVQARDDVFCCVPGGSSFCHPLCFGNNMFLNSAFNT